MDILVNPYLTFSGAGLFRSVGSWIHPKRVEKTYEIIYMTEGVAYLEEEGKELTLRAGELAILEPRKPHSGVRESENVSFYWVHFFADGELPFERRRFDGFEQAYLFRELLHAANLPTRCESAVNSLLVRILSELHSGCAAPRDGTAKTAAELYEWMRASAKASTTVGDVAARFSLSPDHVTRVLKRNYGSGCKEILNMQVLRRAKELLCNTAYQVGEIAYELDFPSENAFLAFFRYHEGAYPSQYRRRFYGTHMNTK